MSKDEIATVLDEIALLMELQGENAFRSNAYRNGARAVSQLEGDLQTLIVDKQLSQQKGIGESLAEKITALYTTGTLPIYDDLRKKVPEGVRLLLRVPSLGPKKIMALRKELNVQSVEDLKKACDEGKVAKLKGQVPGRDSIPL
jgi:DNA polymerase (family X)